MRFGQLAATIRQVSRKALTNQFKKLKKNDLVKREHFKQITPKVEYSLTRKSEMLCHVFKSTEELSKEN